jgi:hypothetical protein
MKRVGIILKIAGFLITCVSVTYAQDNCRVWRQSDERKEGLIIGDINLAVNNIYDLKLKKEARNFHHYANNLHITTKNHIVIRELLFKRGDFLELRLLHETERLLRSKSFIKSAEIVPSEICGDKVSINVKTHDNWTLTPGISYGRTGGVNKYAFELQEKNLFGYGKSLEFKYKNGLDRTQKSIKYNDDNLFGTRNKLDAIYENNSDGKLNFINFYHPFFSLDSTKTWGVRYFDNQRITPIYDSGVIVDEIGQNRETYSINYGRLATRTNDSVHRLVLGFTSDVSSFFNSDDFANTLLPEKRSYDYPWLSYEYFKEDFVERTNLNRMGRIEDISLGHRFFAKFGASFSDSSMHYFLNYSKGLYARNNDMLLVKSSLNGIYDDSTHINSVLDMNLNWYHSQSSNKTFFTRLSLTKSHNLFAENRQYLGGETGLRGYPLRFQNGENKFLLTLEQRFFYNWYPLKTFKFASAIFIDTGAAWNKGEDYTQVTNIGVGLRLVPTRTSSGQIIHLDVALPLNDRDSIDSWQIQLRTKHSF